jgi:uncharacterized protein (TIGR03435 family)
VSKAESFGPWSFHFTADRFQSQNFNVRKLVEFAYHVEDRQVTGLPSWAVDDHYDVKATISEEVMARMKSLAPGEQAEARREMVRDLLSKRFGLIVHQSERSMPGYILRVSQSGEKMETVSPSVAIATTPEAIEKDRSSAPLMNIASGTLHAERIGMDDLSQFLTNELGRSVEDRTQLAGRYNFSLEWNSDSNRGASERFPSAPLGYTAVTAKNDSPGLITAVKEQLGLELTATSVSTKIIAVDHLDRPSAN